MPILDPDVIVRHATVAFEELRALPTWAPSLARATVNPRPLFVTSVAEPVTTPRSRRPPLPHYAIVSIGHEAVVTARFAMHAEAGHLLEAEGVRRVGAVLTPFVDGAALGRSMFGDTASAPEVVWRPCRESVTRFLPFWRFVVLGQARYIRADGKVFDTLTLSGRG